MKKYDTSRRDFMKTSLAGTAIGTLGLLNSRAGQAGETGRRQIKITGYDYDRVRAIMDGHIDLEDAEVGFDVENIYAARRYVFGTDRK